MDSLTAFPRLELKYCERCGGLWLRPGCSATPYCPACEPLMNDLPARSLRHRHMLRRVLDAATLPLFTLLALGPQAIVSGWWA